MHLIQQAELPVSAYFSHSPTWLMVIGQQPWQNAVKEDRIVQLTPRPLESDRGDIWILSWRMLASSRASREIIAEGRVWLLGNLHRSHFINTLDCWRTQLHCSFPNCTSSSSSYENSPNLFSPQWAFSHAGVWVISRVSSLCPLYIPEHRRTPKANPILDDP